MSDHIPREFISLLLAKIDLVDLIHTQVPLRKKSNQNYFARCPFHQEKSASFSVSQPKQFYYCFGCGAHGNAIDFLMELERLSFPEAIETLARMAGMEIPKTTHTSPKKQIATSLYDCMQEASHFYYENMRKTDRAIQYLKTRGISGAIARQFQLGYAGPGWSQLLDTLGTKEHDKHQLFETGLVIKKNEGGYYDRFRDRIIFPIRDLRGRTIGFGGRIIDQGEPKYLNSPETVLFQKGHELYGLYETLQSNRKTPRILIVEGYMDVIALFQHGIHYAVATMGTATTPHHLQRLFRYTAEIIFSFDGDEAGKRAAWRALEVIFPLMHDSLEVRFLFLPDGEDPDSLIHKEQKNAFEKRLETSLSLSTFFFQTLSKEAHMHTLEGRTRFATLALNYIKTLPVGLFQEMILAELSKLARIGVPELKQQIQSPDKAPAIITMAEHKSKMPVPLRLVLALLIQYPKLIALIDEPLPHLEGAGYIFLTQLIEIIRARPNITTGGLIEHWRGEKEGTFVTKLAHWQHLVPEEGVEQEFKGAWRQLLTLYYDEIINHLLAKGAIQPLSQTEKMDLNAWITKKKSLISI